jgi:hypothetical protein
MKAYKPAEHADATSVAPLVQFFELVHVGDTIQSMVQVYFEKELVRLTSFPHIRTYSHSIGTSYRSH